YKSARKRRNFLPRMDADLEIWLLPSIPGVVAVLVVIGVWQVIENRRRLRLFFGALLRSASGAAAEFRVRAAQRPDAPLRAVAARRSASRSSSRAASRSRCRSE